MKKRVKLNRQFIVGIIIDLLLFQFGAVFVPEEMAIAILFIGVPLIAGILMIIFWPIYYVFENDIFKIRYVFGAEKYKWKNIDSICACSEIGGKYIPFFDDYLLIVGEPEDKGFHKFMRGRTHKSRGMKRLFEAYWNDFVEDDLSLIQMIRDWRAKRSKKPLKIDTREVARAERELRHHIRNIIDEISVFAQNIGLEISVEFLYEADGDDYNSRPRTSYIYTANIDISKIENPTDEDTVVCRYNLLVASPRKKDYKIRIKQNTVSNIKEEILATLNEIKNIGCDEYCKALGQDVEKLKSDLNIEE